MQHLQPLIAGESAQSLIAGVYGLRAVDFGDRDDLPVNFHLLPRLIRHVLAALRTRFDSGGDYRKVSIT
jgi:hypothetical protein